MKDEMKNLWVIILAAGKGRRIKAREKNKVTYEVKGVPMILRTLKIVRGVGIKNIVVVVGFAKESVLRLLDKNITIAEQKKRLGTGHAVKMGFEKIPTTARDVLVLNGDDSFLYSPEIIKKLFTVHSKSKAAVSFLTINVKDPTGLGRIVRDKNGKVLVIVEEKDANSKQRKIKEINPACYLFSSQFLRKYIKKIRKSKVTGEYYIVSLIHEAVKNNEKIDVLQINNLQWRGINTHPELQEAEKLLSR